MMRITVEEVGKLGRELCVMNEVVENTWCLHTSRGPQPASCPACIGTGKVIGWRGDYRPCLTCGGSRG